MDDISISIVIYNNYEDTMRAISSIEKNTSTKIKKTIYLIDNGTKNQSQETIMKFLKFIDKFKDIIYIDTKKNLGFGKGHNYVLTKIHSRYHAIVNPDILLKEDSFCAIIKYMNTNKDVGMVIPKIIDKDGNMQKVYRKEVTIQDMFIRMFCPKLFPKRMNEITLNNNNYNREFQVPFGQGSFLVIRTKLFKRINGFDERFFMYMEDADLCKRVNKISKLMYVPYTEVIHKWEKGSHKSKKLFIIHVRSMIKYFFKWGIK